MEAVAKRMTELRESLNLSQLKLSKLLGVSQSAINRYEHNLASAPDNVLLKYADYFDVSADYILGRTEKPEGEVFKNEPELLKRKAVREDEWMDFVEACFDPLSPMNKKLKELVMNMAGGEPQK
ncbi:MAG: helix-turn-helix domain-containing protein [Oscillospiraceae bacterium]|jgi:transcriptional regulator with XRE-family HTH domain|nr:helix-turn-helix domain-containing protein [Oscillospiraceae bacterium]